MVKSRLIVGLDVSYNSPGITVCLCDNDLNVLSRRYLSFSTVKKYVCDRSDGRIIFNDKKNEVSDLQHILEYKEIIWQFIYSIEEDASKHADTELYVGIEDYAYSATGQITRIAEMCHGLKEMLWLGGASIRLYDIASIKIWATGKGNADKIAMEDSYELLTDKFDLSYLPLVREKKAGNPKDNVVDSWYIADMLINELKVRSGIISMKDLSDDKRRIFNRVTKANPVNLLDSPFIKKDSV